MKKHLSGVKLMLNDALWGVFDKKVYLLITSFFRFDFTAFCNYLYITNYYYKLQTEKIMKTLVKRKGFKPLQAHAKNLYCTERHCPIDWKERTI